MRTVLTILLASVPALIRADSWLPPKSFARVSENAATIARIDPGYSNADGTGTKPARCRLFRYSDAKSAYALWREHDLVNPTLPGSVVIPDDGSFVVTFDDYMGIGTSENTIVVYDSAGRVLKRWTLKDILSDAEIAELPHSTLSIHWRSSVGVMLTTQHEVYISPPDSGGRARKFKGFLLDVKALTIREDPRWK